MTKARFRRETFHSRPYFEFRLPKLVRFSTSIIHPFLGSPFLCINFERDIFSRKSHDGLEMAAVLYQLCLLPYV